MEGNRIAVSVVIGFLGLVATSLSIAAEASRKTMGIVSTCDDIRYPLTNLGFSAALILLVTQIVANACGGCVCCCTYGKPLVEGQKRVLATVYLALSWVIFVIGFILLMNGSIVNGQPSNTVVYDEYGNSYIPCYVVRPWIMARGGAMAITSTSFAIAYYLLATQAGSTSTNVVVGQPVAEMGPMQTASTDFEKRSQLGSEA